MLLTADLIATGDGINATTFDPGDTVRIDLVVRNIGDANSRSGRLRYFLNEGSVSYSSTDRVGDDDYFSSLAPNGSSVESTQFQIPISALPGTWYVSYWVDAQNGTSESDEGNNKGWWRITVRAPLPGSPGTPDLRSSDDTGASSSDNITYTTTDLSFNWSSGSNADRYYYGWDDSTPTANWTSNTGVNIDAPSGNGWHTFYVRSWNPSGYSSSRSVNVYIDRTGPTVGAPDLHPTYDSGYQDDDDNTDVTNVLFTYSGNGNGVAIDHYNYGWSSIDLSSSTTSTSVLTSPPSSNGFQTVYIQAASISGRLSGIKSKSVTFDTVAPGSSPLISPNGDITDTSPTLLLRYSGTVDWKFDVDLEHRTPPFGFWEDVPGWPKTVVRAGSIGTSNLSPLTEYRVAIRETDIAGNQGDWSERTYFRVVAPDIAVFGNGVLIEDGDTNPTLSDGRDFGDVDILDSELRTFTIINPGTAPLALDGGLDRVEVLGTHASDFIVALQPNSPVSAGGGATTFQLRFIPSGAGIRTATISIPSNDPDEDPFTFTVKGRGVALPAIEIRGNGNLISDGDTAPDSGDFTEFSDVEAGNSTSRIYTITNSGVGVLNLVSNPDLVNIGGAHASDFRVIQHPGATISSSSSTSFEIEFTPSAAGVRNAVVTIESNAPGNQSPYTFAIQGTATAVPAPQIELSENGATIKNGDEIHLGSLEVSGGIARKTITIINTGAASLALTGGLQRVQLTGDTDDIFLVGGEPASPVTSNGGTSSFQIEFDARTTGQRRVTVSIPNNDPNNDPFVFTVAGIGVRNNGVSGPYVKSAGPPLRDLQNESFDHVVVRFSKPIEANSLTPSVIVLDHDGNRISSLSVERISAVTYRINTPVQTERGTYNLRIAPAVLATDGTLLNSDRDAFNGEDPDDEFVTSFNLDIGEDTAVILATVLNTEDIVHGEELNVSLSKLQPADISHVSLELFQGGIELSNRIGYIYRGQPGDGFPFHIDWVVSPDGIIDTPPESLSGHDFKIRASAFVAGALEPLEDFSDGAFSIFAETPPSHPTPNPISGFEIVDVQSTSATVKWDSDENASNYRVQQSRNNRTWLDFIVPKASAAPGQAEQHTFSNLESDQLYFFKIIPVNFSTASEAFDFTLSTSPKANPRFDLEVLSGGPRPQILDVNENFSIRVADYIERSTSRDLGFELLTTRPPVTNLDLSATGVLSFRTASPAVFSIEVRVTSSKNEVATVSVPIDVRDLDAVASASEKRDLIEASYSTTFHPWICTGDNCSVASQADSPENFTYQGGTSLLQQLTDHWAYASAPSDFQIYALKEFEATPNKAMVRWLQGELSMAALTAYVDPPPNILNRRSSVTALAATANHNVNTGCLGSAGNGILLMLS